MTYYQSCPSLYDESSQWALIDVWRRSWEKAGWETVVMQEHHLADHPRYAFFVEQFRSKPTEYPVDYTAACFLRWFAAYVLGSRDGAPLLLSDYDVINYGMEPRDPEPGKMEILCDEPPASIYMGAVLGQPQNFLDIAELFASWKPDSLDKGYNSGVYHQDDLSMLARMFHPPPGDTARPKPDWLVKRNGWCALFDYASYRTAKLVHYGYQMKHRNYWPKHKYIEHIRPF